MRLSLKALKNVANINTFQYAIQTSIQEGQINDVYFQLVDLDKVILSTEKSALFPEAPLRYIPLAGSTLSIEFPSIDDAQVITVVAINPFPEDLSIFKVLLAADQVPKNGNLKAILTENGLMKPFIVKSIVGVDMLNVGGC